MAFLTSQNGPHPSSSSSQKKCWWGVEKDFKFTIHKQIIYPTRLSKQRLSATDKQVNEEAVPFILRNLNMNINAPRPVVQCLIRNMFTTGFYPLLGI